MPAKKGAKKAKAKKNEKHLQFEEENQQEEQVRRKMATKPTITEDSGDEVDSGGAQGKAKTMVSKAKAPPQTVKDMSGDEGDEEPSKKQQPFKGKGKAKSKSEKARDMPTLSTEEDESETDNNKPVSEVETESQDTENDADDHESPVKAGPSKKAKAAPKTKASVAPSKIKKDTKQMESDSESIFDKPQTKRTRNKAIGDDQESGKPSAKAAPPRKATATKAVKPKKGANAKEEQEEKAEDDDDDDDDDDDAFDDESLQAKKGGSVAKEGDKENDPPNRTKNGGKTDKVSKPDQPSKKAPAKPKGEINIDMDPDDEVGAHEKSLHINLPKKATIAEKITEAVKLLAGRIGKCSLKQVKAFLEKENQFDVNRHNDKIKTHLKQMFEDKQIVPVNRIKDKPSVTVVFKLGGILKTKMSSAKRKSISVAEKKMKQNNTLKGTKRTKQTPRISTSGKLLKTKKKAKQPRSETADASDLETFEDDQDVPPQYR